MTISVRRRMRASAPAPVLAAAEPAFAAAFRLIFKMTLAQAAKRAAAASEGR